MDDTKQIDILLESMDSVEKNVNLAEAKVKEFYSLQVQISEIQKEVKELYKNSEKEMKFVEKKYTYVTISFHFHRVNWRTLYQRRGHY